MKINVAVKAKVKGQVEVKVNVKVQGECMVVRARAM